MQHFYDGQVRRYITQIIRLMSNFSYKDGDDNHGNSIVGTVSSTSISFSNSILFLDIYILCYFNFCNSISTKI